MSMFPAVLWHCLCCCPVTSEGQECKELEGTGLCWEAMCRPGLDRSLESEHMFQSHSVACIANRFIRRGKKKWPVKIVGMWNVNVGDPTTQPKWEISGKERRLPQELAPLFS